MMPLLTAVLWSPSLPWLAETALVIVATFVMSLLWSRAIELVWATGWDAQRLLVFTQAPIRFLLFVWVWSTLVGLTTPDPWTDSATGFMRHSGAQFYGAIVVTILASLWGARNLRDVISGLVLAATRPFRVGDEVAVGDAQGRVANVGLLRVRIATLEGELVDIPTSSMTTQAVRIAPRYGGALPLTVEVEIAGFDGRDEAIDALYDHARLSIYADASLPVTVEVMGARQARVTVTPTHPEDADALRRDIASRARRGVNVHA